MKKVFTFLFVLFVLSTTAHKEKKFADLIQSQDTTKVGICHKQGQTWVYKLVNENTLNGHFNHGDFLYKGRPDVYDWEMDDWCVINAPTK